MTLARILDAMSHRISKSIHPSILLELRRKVFSISQLGTILAIDFFIDAFYHVEEVPFYYYFDESIYQE